MTGRTYSTPRLDISHVSIGIAHEGTIDIQSRCVALRKGCYQQMTLCKSWLRDTKVVHHQQNTVIVVSLESAHL